MDLTMKNLKYGLKLNYKKIVIVCIILLSFSFEIAKNNLILYKDIQNEEMLNIALDNQNYTILYFYKNGCTVCQKYKSVINKLITNNNYMIYGFDIENKNFDEIEIISKFNLNEVPTIVILKQNKEIIKYEGFIEYKVLVKKISLVINEK